MGLMSRMSGFKGLSDLERDAASATSKLQGLEQQLARMQFMNQTGSRSYQWTAMQHNQAQQAASEAQQALLIGQQQSMQGAMAASAAASAAHAQAMRGVGLMAGGVVAAGVGLAGADVLDHWIHSAGELETAMNNVRLATGATNAQLQQMEHGDIQIGLKNQMSIIDVEALRATAAQSGLNNVTQLNALLPELARFAEVLKVTKGYSAEQSAVAGTSFAHLFQAFTAQQISPLLDQFARALQTTHSTPQQFITTLSGFVGAATPMYGPGRQPRAASDAIAMTALLGNLGQQGRGGTQLQSLITGTMDMLSTRGATHNAALQAIQQLAGTQKGAPHTFFDDKGQFIGMANMLEVLHAASVAAGDPRNAAMLNRATFTSAGARAAGLLAQPAVVERFQAIEQNVSGKGSLFSLDASRDFINATQQSRFQQLQSNLETISALMGQKILPAVVAVATALTQATAGIIDFVDQHPLLAQIAATFVVVGTVVSLLAAPVLLAAGAFTVLAGTALFADLAFAPFLLVVLGFIAVMTLYVTIATHMGAITKAIGQLFSWLGTQIHNALLQLEAFTRLINSGLPKAGNLNPFAVAPGSPLDHILQWAGQPAAGGKGGGYAGPPLTLVSPVPAQPSRRVPLTTFGGPGGRPGAPGRVSGAPASAGQVVHMQPGAIQVHLHALPSESHQQVAERVAVEVGKQFGKVGKQLDNHPRYQGRQVLGLHPTYRPA